MMHRASRAASFMRKLILIRHGDTDYTLNKRYCGQRNTPLNKRGIAQAKRLRKKLKGLRIDKVYSSDLKRAYQTAEIVFKGKRIVKRRGLREIDFGRFCGLSFQESTKLYPAVYNLWMNNPIDAKIPEGESVKTFAKRVLKTFKKIFKQNRKKVVAIVSHGGPIRVMLLYLLGLGFDKFWEIDVGVTHVKTVEFKKDKVYFCIGRGKKRKEPF